MSLFGCLLGERTVDLKSISLLTIIEKKSEQGEVILTLKGLIFDSALGIDKIEVNQIGSEVNIVVRIMLAGKTRNGNLYYRVDLPKEISTVTFGSNRDLLWSKTEGIVKSIYIRGEQEK